MSVTTEDRLLRRLDEFLGAVYWSEEPITLEVALTEAIEDWVATASAEHHESKPFCATGTDHELGSALMHMAASVDAIAAENSAVTMASALSEAAADWVTRAQ